MGIVPLAPLLPFEPSEPLDSLELLVDSVDDWSALKLFERRFFRWSKKGILPAEGCRPVESPLP